MNSSGNYTKKLFKRKLAKEYIELTKHMFYMTGLTELDVTEARSIIRAHKEKTGETICFTAWIVYCVGKATGANLAVQAMRKGKHLIIFEDVDITVPVEKKIDGKPVPSLLIIRSANKKSLREIHDMIRGTQAIETEERTSGMNRNTLDMILALPRFIRNFVLWRPMVRNPFFRKKHNGTVQVIPVGMFGQDHTYFGINLGNNPINVVVGSIVKKPRYIDDKLENREFLCLTIKLDHITVDGAPGTRFGKKLADLIETADGLNDF